MSEAAAAWRDSLVAYLQDQARPTHKFGHQPRLYALTQTIAANTPDLCYDDDVVFAAAYLHDLGVFVGHRPENPKALQTWDHVAYACNHASDLLPGLGFPAAKLPGVLAAIREHQPHDEPHSPESLLLRDADILEQLGALGILRTASKLGSDTRFHSFQDVRNALQRAIDRLPGAIRLSATQALAAGRVRTLQAFLEALDDEAGACLG